MTNLEKYQNKFYQMIRRNDFIIDDEIKREYTEKMFAELVNSTLWISGSCIINFHLDNNQIWMEPYCGCVEGLGEGSYHIGYFINGVVVIDEFLTKKSAKDIYKYAFMRLSKIERSINDGNCIEEEDSMFLWSISSICGLLSSKVIELENRINN